MFKTKFLCAEFSLPNFFSVHVFAYTLIMRGEQQNSLLQLLSCSTTIAKNTSHFLNGEAGSKNVSLSLRALLVVLLLILQYTNNLDDGHEKTRSSVVKVKIVFRRLRKKDLLVHNTYLLLLCIFFLYYFLSGTRQSAKNSFHIMPDNKHTHTQIQSMGLLMCSYLYSLAFVFTCNKLIRKTRRIHCSLH